MSTDSQWVATMPEVYDGCLGPALFAPFADRVAATAAARSPGRVLELAAGTGILTAELVCALPAADITATDLNPAMVSWAADRVPGAAWLPADAQHLDLPDGCFDLVACQFGVMFFPDKPAAFAEAARVLLPGATLLFTVWDAVETSDFPAAMMESLRAVLPQDPPDFIVRVPHGYCDPDRVTADLAAGGLICDGVERIVLRGRASSAQQINRGFCLGTPLRFALQERGSLETLTRELEEEMVARLGAGPVESDLAAFLVTAHTPA
ncbi:MAG TPA: class I SAM-dependent methyltransferase [Jatrophihabitans sp.]|nr:class I SAM-dependent methyltransferase [Jatrophihabitans sp.]